MTSELQFVIAAVVIALAVLAAKIGPKNVIPFFKAEENRGILKGIVLAVAFCIVAAVIGLLTGCAGGKYLNYASAYAGLEDTKKTSPMCEDGDKTTSNLGLRVNLYQSADKKFHTNAKYTHHSCAFSPDDKSYDAAGVELEYRFFQR